MQRKNPLRKLGAMLPPQLRPPPAPTLPPRMVSSQPGLAPRTRLCRRVLLMRTPSPLLQRLQLQTARLLQRWNLPRNAPRHEQPAASAAGIAAARNRLPHPDHQRWTGNRDDRRRQALKAAVAAAASLGPTAIEGLAGVPTEGLMPCLGPVETLHRRQREQRRGEGAATRAGRGCAPVNSSSSRLSVVAAAVSPAGTMPHPPR